jgi:hypothetical protein
MRQRGIAVLVAAALSAGASACSQPGTQAPPHQAAQLDVATSRISVACGTAEELGAYGPASPAGLAQAEALAISGAHKLASVFNHDQADIYQGESVGAIVHDSISLLGDCGLPQARNVLEHVLGH